MTNHCWHLEVNGSLRTQKFSSLCQTYLEIVINRPNLKEPQPVWWCAWAQCPWTGWWGPWSWWSCGDILAGPRPRYDPHPVGSCCRSCRPPPNKHKRSGLQCCGPPPPQTAPRISSHFGGGGSGSCYQYKEFLPQPRVRRLLEKFLRMPPTMRLFKLTYKK